MFTPRVHASKWQTYRIKIEKTTRFIFEHLTHALKIHSRGFYSNSRWNAPVPGIKWKHCGRLPKIDQNFKVSFPTTACPPTFHKTNVLHNDLKKDAINEFEIKYWTSNPVWVIFQEHGSFFYVNIEEKVWLLVKKILTWKDWYDRATKTSLFDRNWAISLKPRRKSRPLRLVWWALQVWLYLLLKFAVPIQ
jgi:hypothetical protein